MLLLLLAHMEMLAARWSPPAYAAVLAALALTFAAQAIAMLTRNRNGSSGPRVTSPGQLAHGSGDS